MVCACSTWGWRPAQATPSIAGLVIFPLGLRMTASRLTEEYCGWQSGTFSRRELTFLLHVRRSDRAGPLEDAICVVDIVSFFVRTRLYGDSGSRQHLGRRPDP